MTRRFTHIARDLQTRIGRLFDAPLGADATPLEISRAAIDEIERKLQPVGRGRRIFPYSRVVVRVRQSDGERAALEAAFADIRERLRERFAELNAEAPGELDVKVVFLKKPPAGWGADQVFGLEFQAQGRGAATDEALTSAAPSVNITIVKGAAARRVYSFSDPLISIGRTPDPAGQAGTVRRNRVAFLDTADGVTETVGRVHAHLQFDPRTREYRLFDDGSSNGTAILRSGAAIPVPPRDPQGVRVRSGDEVQVGRAVLRITFLAAETRRPDGKW